MAEDAYLRIPRLLGGFLVLLFTFAKLDHGDDQEQEQKIHLEVLRHLLPILPSFDFLR